MKVAEMWADMARRKVKFHSRERWQDIRLWGLFHWGEVKRLLDRGLLITDMGKENGIVWVRPSERAYREHIKPLIEKHTVEELTEMAGWYKEVGRC